MTKRYRLEKEVLAVNDYESPDGTVRVTPERLRTWKRNFDFMKKRRQIIPSHWDHGDDYTPKSVKEYKQSLSAGTTVGRLADIEILPGGKRAKFILEYADKKAYERAKANLVGVSPVIMPSWRIGTGEVIEDCITAVDLVDHPVDYSQGPFVEAGAGSTAIAMSLRLGPSKVCLMAKKRTPVKKAASPKRMSAKQVAEAEEAKKRLRMSVDDDDDDDIDNDGDGAVDEDGEGTDEVGSQKDVDAVVEALKAMDIVLPEGTTKENFFERVHSALLTAAAHRGEDEGDGTNNDSGVVESAPPPAMMSMNHQDPAYVWAQQQYRDSLKAKLDHLVETGRATPAERDARIKQVNTVRLSLGKDQKPLKTLVEEFIESRQNVPPGTFWDVATRTKKMGLSVAPQPSQVGNELTDEEADKIVDSMFGKR